MNSVQDFVHICQSHNLKVTPQRIAIYRHLSQSKEHPTAEAVYQIIRNEFPNISFDTINRTLLTFADIGIIDVIEGFGGPKRFDPNRDNHHHLHCVACGAIIDFRSEELDKLRLPPGIERRFTILNKKVVLKGLCEQCRK